MLLIVCFLAIAAADSLKQYGVALKGCEVAKRDTKSVLVATKAVGKDDVLVTVPLANVPRTSEMQDKGLSGLVEYFTSHPQAEYLNDFNFSEPAVFWPDDVLELLEPSPVAVLAKTYKARLAESDQNAARLALAHTVDVGDDIVFFPLVANLNRALKGNVAVAIDGETLQLVAAEDMEKGTEFKLTGDSVNTTVRYGAASDMTYLLTLSIPDDTFANKLRKVLFKEFILVTDAQTLLRDIRMLNADGLADLDRADDVISMENEARACKAIARTFAEMLGGYKLATEDAYKEYIAELKKDPSSLRARALQYTLDERELLRGILTATKEHWLAFIS